MPDECDACVNPAKCGAEGRCAEYDSPLQPHTGRGTRDNCPTCGASVEVVTGAEGTSYFRATDLAERLLDYANRFEDNAGVPSNALEADLREAAQLARAASPPHTGEARVEGEDVERLKDLVELFDRDIGHDRLYAESLTRVLAALEPASTPEPPEDDRA